MRKFFGALVVEESGASDVGVVAARGPWYSASQGKPTKKSDVLDEPVLSGSWLGESFCWKVFEPEEPDTCRADCSARTFLDSMNLCNFSPQIRALWLNWKIWGDSVSIDLHRQGG